MSTEPGNNTATPQTPSGGENNSPEAVIVTNEGPGSEQEPGEQQPAPATKPPQTKTEEQPAPPKPPTRFTKTVVFSPEEFAYTDAIFKARNESGLSDDYNHFIRQCIDFALNNEFNKAATGGVWFAKPDIPKLHFKNGFFNKK